EWLTHSRLGQIAARQAGADLVQGATDRAEAVVEDVKRLDHAREVGAALLVHGLVPVLVEEGGVEVRVVETVVDEVDAGLHLTEAITELVDVAPQGVGGGAALVLRVLHELGRLIAAP